MRLIVRLMAKVTGSRQPRQIAVFDKLPGAGAGAGAGAGDGDGIR